MSNKLVLNGDLIFESIFLFRDREHQHPIQNWQILSGTLTLFKKGVTSVTLLQALENLPDPFTFDEKSGVLTERTPQKISWLVYAQFRYKGQPVEISLSDLSMNLFYDESYKHVCPFIQIQFPKREITNNSNFAIKITLIKSMEHLAWCYGVTVSEHLTQTKAIVEKDPDWTNFKASLTEKEQRNWSIKLPELRFFHMKICGCAKEMR